MIDFLKAFDLMIVFDIIVLILGIYLLVSGIKSKKENSIPTAIMPAETLKTCHNLTGLVNYLAPKIMIFGTLSCIFGLEGLINDAFYKLNTYINVGCIFLFLGSWIWFSAHLTKARNTFCS